MVPILINKDVFEPSYNDLKFTVWNHNYVCTSLIVSSIDKCLCTSGVIKSTVYNSEYHCIIYCSYNTQLP